MTSGWINRFNPNSGSCDGRNVLNTARRIIRLKICKPVILNLETHNPLVCVVAGNAEGLQKTPLAYDHCTSPLQDAHPKRKFQRYPLHIGKVYIGGS